ncbi:MAG: hypothetical protein K6B28_01110 [Lachnospiraceae bacterium]|nr:hypothetical protein [Lachnospiraceae bacterium]
MIITNSEIGMESARKYNSVRRDAYFSSNARINEDGEKDDSFENSMKDLFGKSDKTVKTGNTPGYDKLEQDAISRIRNECIFYLIRILLGDKIDGQTDAGNFTLTEITSGKAGNNGYLIQNRKEEHYYAESEETAFSTTGKVVTADGRELEFNLSLEMSRSFETYYSKEEVSMIPLMCDPLVINLDTDVAEVSDQRFLFDLDVDGKEDNIPLLASSSGYLSLDLNGDGVINDGSELFGTKTGDGFYDLSKYDEDGNGFIDEADAVFDKLRICVFDKDGKQTLYKLKDKDVGAIGLANVRTDFSLNDLKTNKVNAAIRKTGIFLYENGNVGTVQHLDLAKELLA